MKGVILILLALLLAASAHAQDRIMGDPSVTRQDLADLKARIFNLIDVFDGQWGRPSKVEKIVGVPLSKGADGWFSATGFHSLDYSQNFQPRHTASTGPGSTVYASYIGAFDFVPFGDQPDKCLNVSDFRNHLISKGWKETAPTTGPDNETDYRFFKLVKALRLATYGNNCVVELNLS